MRTKKDSNSAKKIHIFDNFYFRGDESQFILLENVVRKSKKDQKEYMGEITLGYYPTIQSLCKGLVKTCTLRSISDWRVDSLGDVVNEADKVIKKLETIIKY